MVRPACGQKGLENMKPVSDNLEDYLWATEVIDWEHPCIIEKAREITRVCSDEVERAKAFFEWVRDEIPHSKDIGSDLVTCTASEVLREGTGICYAKSHLLAALLRAIGIPAGLCYQALTRDPPYTGICLHGLNGVYLRSLGRWILLDARGNTGEIDARFSTDERSLAFPMDPEQGEFLYEEIYPDPLPEVVAVLTSFTSRNEMWSHLPGPTPGVRG